MARVGFLVGGKGILTTWERDHDRWYQSICDNASPPLSFAVYTLTQLNTGFLPAQINLSIVVLCDLCNKGGKWRGNFLDF